MKSRGSGDVVPSLPGPGRWTFKQYDIIERMPPRGRRYEIRSPTKELVAVCRIKKGADHVTFYATDEESQELLRLTSKKMPQYAAAFVVIDAPSGRTIGEFRKKVYKPVGKSEWFIYDAEGEPQGMLTENVQAPKGLRRFVPVPIPQGRSYQLHWGQTIVGSIERKQHVITGDRTTVDLVLDKKDEIDRRLALSIAILVRDDERNGRAE